MNIIAYRLPGEQEVFIYRAEKTGKPLFRPDNKSFLIAPFHPEKPAIQYELKNRLECIPEMNQKSRNALAVNELTKEEYADYLSHIKKSIDGDLERKTVAARRKRVPVTRSVNDIFKNLCESFPQAFVFYIDTEDNGCWIGASPELLLKREGNTLESMALAGTRSAGCDAPWDEKNLREQAIVTKTIKETFENHGLLCRETEVQTKNAGSIEHLMTRLSAECSDEVDISALLNELSPTPALCGYPREVSLETILKYEGDRELYGGYMGVINPKGNFLLNVILRCAGLENEREAVLFGGGGITAMSETEAEWMETEKKMGGLKKILGAE